MQLIVNGQSRQFSEELDLAELVNQISDRPTGIAVALNNEVVPRAAWGTTDLGDGDRVDVVTAVQGG